MPKSTCVLGVSYVACRVFIDRIDGLDSNPTELRLIEESFGDFKPLYGFLFLPEKDQDPCILVLLKTFPDDFTVFSQE